jgi:hypothetical protein
MLVAACLILPARTGPPLRAANLVTGSTRFAADLGSGLALVFFKALLTFTKMDDNMVKRHSFRQVASNI